MVTTQILDVQTSNKLKMGNLAIRNLKIIIKEQAKSYKICNKRLGINCYSNELLNLFKQPILILSTNCIF